MVIVLIIDYADTPYNAITALNRPIRNKWCFSGKIHYIMLSKVHGAYGKRKRK